MAQIKSVLNTAVNRLSDPDTLCRVQHSYYLYRYKLLIIKFSVYVELNTKWYWLPVMLISETTVTGNSMPVEFQNQMIMPPHNKL